MARIERNLVANFCGIGVAAGAPLLFNILYYRLLGSEAYGLVGLYLTVQMLAVSLDLGLTRATTRKVAQVISHGQGSIRTSVLTLLIVNSLLFLLFGLLVIASSGWIATVWLADSRISDNEVITVICLIGAAVALQQPRTIFLGALNGLQGQVLTNILIAGAAIIRGLVTLVVISASPNLAAFFWTQLVLTAIETLVMGMVVWRRLPGGDVTPHVDFTMLRRVGRFALGDGLNVVTGTFVIHADKLLLSGLVSLQAFGTFSLLSLLAQSLARLAAPFTVAYFPPLVEFWQKQDSAGFVDCFQRASLGLSALLIPATFAAIALSAPVVQIVLIEGAGIAYPEAVLVILSVAFASNAMMHLPYTVQLASGWTRTGLVMNLIVFCLYVPLLWLLIPEYGVYAAAWLLLAAMFIPMPIFIEITRRRFLGGSAWWRKFFVMPVLISGGCLLPVYLLRGLFNPWITIATGIVAGLVAVFLIRYTAGETGRSEFHTSL